MWIYFLILNMFTWSNWKCWNTRFEETHPDSRGPRLVGQFFAKLCVRQSESGTSKVCVVITVTMILSRTYSNGHFKPEEESAHMWVRETLWLSCIWKSESLIYFGTRSGFVLPWLTLTPMGLWCITTFPYCHLKNVPFS